MEDFPRAGRSETKCPRKLPRATESGALEHVLYASKLTLATLEPFRCKCPRKLPWAEWAGRNAHVNSQEFIKKYQKTTIFRFAVKREDSEKPNEKAGVFPRASGTQKIGFSTVWVETGGKTREMPTTKLVRHEMPTKCPRKKTRAARAEKNQPSGPRILGQMPTGKHVGRAELHFF